MKTILYLLPHHDDEVFVIPKIAKDLRGSDQILFVFLTGDDRRLNESRAFLKLIGGTRIELVPLYQHLEISDGQIHLKISLVYQKILALLSERPGPICEILTTAYEGGHQDHDTTALLAAALAKKLHCQLSEYFLYNGYQTLGRKYRVAFPLSSKTSQVAHLKYSYKVLFILLLVPFIFRSQLKSMLGLLPFLLMKSLLGPLHLRITEPKMIQAFQLEPNPLYVRWGRVKIDDVLTLHKKFESTEL